ncbi:NAD(P)H-hydrate dehydratase [Corynebacterium flavescens]|uniref:ADP-dependent NAD(P)H-hydrate dehydratase n=2 Tax=Corynebacterium flavescens TaxID=28028 RepID=UPI002648C5DB|nr:NAD(P)H-hydrate dehydratase [Corynebacterium flavescens]MDN6521838.1 hypothetical protein [Bifidobacterium crudilactis]
MTLYDETLDLLQELIRNACVNDFTPGSGQEVRNADTLARFFADTPRAVLQRFEPEPGRISLIVKIEGTDPDAEPLTFMGHTIIDADALRIIAHDESIRDAVRAHPFVVLTPHYGEFTALYESCVGPLSQEVGRAQLMSDLAQALDCFVMLKGRITHVTAPGLPVYGVNAGHSYAATPGSGDVLSGILGAVLAQQFFLAETEQLSKREIDTAIMEILHTNSLHIHASLEAARTPHGMAIATASRIADAIPAALAKLLTMAR